jgi:hypothetical protein
MCTVAFHPGRDDYVLGMNRDEQRTRAIGRPPAERRVGDLRLLAPAEPSGGTWIATDETGITWALINWYSIPARARGAIQSRGNVIPGVAAAREPGEASERLRQLPLGQTHPFRLIGVFPAREEVFEWRWNLEALRTIAHDWRPGVWISSGHDEAGAQQTRGNFFQRAVDQPDAGSAAWLQRLHASHAPEPGPYSICMHRDDAVTVSYTQVEASRAAHRMTYRAGAPCTNPATFLCELPPHA